MLNRLENGHSARVTLLSYDNPTEHLSTGTRMISLPQLDQSYKHFTQSECSNI
jgi:hypothetical protein